MGKLRQLSPELWPLIDVILFSYIELIFRDGVSCLPAALLLLLGCCFNGKNATPNCVEFDSLSITDEASLCVEAVRTVCSSNDVVLGSLESRREN